MNENKKRARSVDEKALRKQSIIDALSSLLNTSHELPSANQIAKQAGVTKGVIYRYFSTREEIFLSLLLQLSEPLEQVFAQDLDDIEQLKTLMINFYLNNPQFMLLGLAAPIVLEQNISAAVVKNFKLKAASIMDALAQSIAPFCSNSLAQRRQFINSFYQLSLMKWQHCNAPQHVLDVFEPQECWIVGRPLEQELSDSFDWLWAGLVAQAI
ncbi:TetR/AcrR family transcriptional regulator [Alginatibacterium sediminis]|uniref:TetR/AcrR family transcriptional regulator n=1 Tax=Alginatibacterium sediminis TaxID=2164068 RepID=A0A420EI50_9ALTE|nr:TetR family transcriptional regulator [Alginatibacterium sediminis]RKF20236.1 TetR/AcrR family transcriptional regulator [Alginatibacterium sediminis]